MALALAGVPIVPDARVLVGSSTADDAGVFLISPDRALVQTVDVLAPVTDDPYTFGKIAAVNSLSDVWAMGGKPLCALGVIGFPASGDPKVMSDILRGGQDAVVEAGAALVGGHSFASDEVRYGLSVTGEIDPQRVFANAGARDGDALVLTKPLGVGVIIAALVSRGTLNDRILQNAIKSMLTPNRAASEAMQRCQASACTDVTGFGLLGHLFELANASKVSITLHCEKIPILPTALELLKEDVKDPALKNNRNSFADYVDFATNIPDEYRNLLFGSETSGGLLITLSPKDADNLIDDLAAASQSAVIIGEVCSGNVKINVK